MAVKGVAESGTFVAKGVTLAVEGGVDSGTLVGSGSTSTSMLRVESSKSTVRFCVEALGGDVLMKDSFITDLDVEAVGCLVISEGDGTGTDTDAVVPVGKTFWR